MFSPGTSIRQAWARLVSFFRKRDLDRELDEELASHIGLATEDYLQRGMPLSEARRLARIKLGAIEASKDAHRDARGVRWLEDFLSDLKYAARMFVQSPGFTIAAVAAIAIGIGANTAIFSVVNTVLLKPLPYPDSDRIVQIEESYAGVGSPNVGVGRVSLWRQRTTVFQDISAHWLDHLNLTGGATPELLPVARVTADFFRLYGAPILP